jgi:hypothetical protein
MKVKLFKDALKSQCHEIFDIWGFFIKQFQLLATDSSYKIFSNVNEFAEILKTCGLAQCTHSAGLFV